MAGLSCGIVGLPNVGKSTLFNALTAKAAEAAAAAEASNYPFCTIDPNTRLVDVDDPRLQVLSQLSKSKNIIPATVQFVDIAGLVEGASKGEGLGNKFLANIRETEAIVHVVRCFDSSDIIHVAGVVDPVKDVEVVNLELCLADMQMVEGAIVKCEKQAKGKKELLVSLETLKKVKAHLDEGKAARSLTLSKEELVSIKAYPLLTMKPVLYVANVDEGALPEMENRYVEALRHYVESEGSAMMTICAQLEAEIAQLPREEREEFLGSLGLKESGLQRLVKGTYKMLGLISYLTTGDIETRAWTIRKGETAVQAAGKIHGDIQKGFIRAEVVAFDDMVACKSRVAAREAGKARSEGKEYIVQDGDVILFLHN